MARGTATTITNNRRRCADGPIGRSPGSAPRNRSTAARPGRTSVSSSKRRRVAKSASRRTGSFSAESVTSARRSTTTGRMCISIMERRHSGGRCVLGAVDSLEHVVAALRHAAQSGQGRTVQQRGDLRVVRDEARRSARVERAAQDPQRGQLVSADRGQGTGHRH